MAMDRRLQFTPTLSSSLNEPGTHYTKKKVQRTPMLLRPTNMSLNYVTGCLVNSPFSRETKRPLSMRAQTEVCEESTHLSSRLWTHGPTECQLRTSGLCWPKCCPSLRSI